MVRFCTALGCGRPALFRDAKGNVKADSQHDLCARHWRDHRNKMSAEVRKLKQEQKKQWLYFRR